MTAPESPQAFPGAYCVGPNDDLYPPTPGMTLRDWFAGQALAGICGNEHAIASLSWSEQPHQERAELCFAIADAMLAERAKGGAA